MDAHQEQEYGDEEGGESEATLDEIPRCIGTNAATGVTEFMMLVHDFPFPRHLNQTLIGCTRREIGNKRHGEISGHKEQQNAQEKAQFLVGKEILKT
jgi:hypothetical protein